MPATGAIQRPGPTRRRFMTLCVVIECCSNNIVADHFDGHRRIRVSARTAGRAEMRHQLWRTRRRLLDLGCYHRAEGYLQLGDDLQAIAPVSRSLYLKLGGAECMSVAAAGASLSGLRTGGGLRARVPARCSRSAPVWGIEAQSQGLRRPDRAALPRMRRCQQMCAGCRSLAAAGKEDLRGGILTLPAAIAIANDERACRLLPRPSPPMTILT